MTGSVTVLGLATALGLVFAVATCLPAAPSQAAGFIAQPADEKARASIGRNVIT